MNRARVGQVSELEEIEFGRPVRLLFVITSSDFGGSEEFLRQLVTGLDRKKFDITICSLQHVGRAGASLASQGFEIFSLNMSERPKIGETLQSTRRLAKLIDQVGIDLIQGLLYRANAIAALAARLSRSHPIVVAGQRSLGPMRGRLPHWVARWSHRASTRVVAVSAAVKQELVKGSAVPTSKIEVIGNGVDTDRFRPNGDGGLRHDLGLGTADIVVGAVGRLSTKKGLRFLLDSLRMALERDAQLRLLVIGEGPARASLEAQTASLELKGEVAFLGFRSDLDRIYPALDIFALPSLEEGSPNALLEAMSCGCAPIASAVGGVPEIIDNGVSGLLVQPGASDQLAEALVELASNSNLKDSIRRAARQRIERDFDFSRTILRYQSLYLSLIAGSGKEALPTR